MSDKKPQVGSSGTERLASLTQKFAFRPTGNTVFSRYSNMVSRANVSETHVQSLTRRFPHVPERSIRDALLQHQTSELASAHLKRTFPVSAHDDRERQPQKSTAGSSPKPMSMTALLAQPQVKPQFNMTSTKPLMSIRDKYSHRLDQRPDPRQDRQDRQQSPAAKKKKLVRKQFDDEDEAPASDSESEAERDLDEDDGPFLDRVLEFVNTASVDDIVDVSAGSRADAQLLADARPFSTLDLASAVDVQSEPDTTGKRKRSSNRKTAGDKIVTACMATLRGYEAVDDLIKRCADYSQSVESDISAWGLGSLVDYKGEEDTTAANSSFISQKPALLDASISLKPYQQIGLNWLNLLYSKQLSCILADEMGLGKTCQVISFLAHLKQQQPNQSGPHLVVVPSSTLENWLREFAKFCPDLAVEPYYGSQQERAEIRDTLEANPGYDVVVTTYNIACGSKADHAFLKDHRFNVCIYDEGHMLKNSQSDRYRKLMRIKAQFRILLTGTPLQNNLKELMSLLAFICPALFDKNKDDLEVIFRHKARASDETRDSTHPLLSEQRIEKAKTMMTPFVLRRRKDQVLQHLPAKSHEVIYCDLHPAQTTLYKNTLERIRRQVRDRLAGAPKNRRDLVGNGLMELRKAAIHPLLFRQYYSNAKLHNMATQILKEPTFAESVHKFVVEDMEVMTDFELNRLCQKYPDTMTKFQMDDDLWYHSGKVQRLMELLPPMKARGDRILLFSQFTQVLDLLEVVLERAQIRFLRLDGQTAVSARQELIDQYYKDTTITVFLLSTKAGGFGINLACANVVIIHDLSFNPHDDRQAEDRAHRVGQTRPVKVIRMVTRATIEENIMQLANTKLALDRSVSDEKEAQGLETKNQALVAKMVLGVSEPDDSSGFVSELSSPSSILSPV